MTNTTIRKDFSETVGAIMGRRRRIADLSPEEQKVLADAAFERDLAWARAEKSAGYSQAVIVPQARLALK